MLPARALISCLTAFAVLGSSAVTAAASSESSLTTSLGAITRAEFADGAPGLIGVTASQTIDPPPAGPRFLGGGVVEDAALEGAWGQVGELGSWLAPESASPAQTFRPQLSLNESLVFENEYVDGAPLQAGDRAGFGLSVVPLDAPLPWDAERAGAGGTLEWEAVSLTQQSSSSFGGVDGSLDAFMFRADVVARGGDVDARGAPIALPPLVLDLPRTYPADAKYNGISGVTTPLTTYFDDFTFAPALPAGKVVVHAQMRGYIPEARTRTLPNGSVERRWHLPLLGVLGIVTEGEGASVAALGLPGGGVVRNVVTDEVAPVGAGELALATSDTTSIDTVDDAPAASAASSDTITDAAALVDRDLEEPVRIEQGSSGFGVTVDPDLHGSGVLALRDVRSNLWREVYADTAAVPAVRVNGSDVMLTRDRLLGLRAVPVRDGGGIRVTPSAAWADGGLNNSTMMSREIPGGGLMVEAVYRLPEDIIVTVQHQLFHQGTPEGGRLNTTVRGFALDGRELAVHAIGYAEVPPSQVTYNDASLTSEAAFSSGRYLELGPRRVDATFRSGLSIRSGTTTILRAPSSLLGRAPDPTATLDGPLAAVLAPPANIPAAAISLSTLRFGLVRPPAPPAQPPALGEPCRGVQIEDPIDGPPTHDIRRAWVDADATNLYFSIEASEVPAGPAVPPLTYAFYFLHDHQGYFVEAVQKTSGDWVFQAGMVGAGFRIPLQGEVVPGPGGVVRIASPQDMFDLRPGDVLRDLGAHAFTAANRAVDSAPNGSNLSFGTGGDFQIVPCTTTQEILGTVLEVAGPDPVQYSDAFALEGALVDEDGAALAGRSVEVSVAGPDGAAAAWQTTTGADGSFALSEVASFAPGDYEVTVAFAGEPGAYEASTASAPLQVLQEDTALSVMVTGRGAKRVLQATLTDLDSGVGVAQRTIDFVADGVTLGSGVTDDTGTAVFDLPPRYQGGHHDYVARFAGDAFFEPANSQTRS